MAFQEKSAWIMALALFTAAGLYFGTVLSMSAQAGDWVSPDLPALLVYTVGLVAVVIIGHAIVAALSPKEANARLDERERLIKMRAGNICGYILTSGVVISLSLYWLHTNGDLLFYSVFGALMLAQLAEFLLQILYYRMGRA